MGLKLWINIPDYTVQWKNYDNTILETDLNVTEGTTPTYDGATPTRSGYTFTGWNPIPTPIYSDTNYIAQYVEAEANNRGPCPSGYHIPSQTEWGQFRILGISIGAWDNSGGDNFKNYLKMPFAGWRLGTNATLYNQGLSGFYWTSTSYPSDTFRSYNIDIRSGTIAYPTGYNRESGASIRPFKNTFVVPTSSWTTIYGTLGGAGIFWDQTNGIISVTGDGTTGYTIADKNLGATQVYNDRDTLSQANCGYYYQRGNNYGFPRTGSVTTSSTQVDATGYGPSNPYSSSTFITRNSSPYGWDSSNNVLLWGG